MKSPTSVSADLDLAAEVREIPAKGHDPKALLKAMQGMREGDADWRGGRTFSLVYSAGEEHQQFLKQAHNLFFSENGLNPMAFKSLQRMEHETVRMSAGLLHGDSEVVGTLTSGGTESILLAVKTYRDMARRRRPWVWRPEIVVPRSIHVAFDKAAHLFGLRMRRAPLLDDGRVDVRALKRLIGRNTVMIAASAPQYPHGVIDPIEEIAALAARRNIPFHVDSCIGGFLLPWAEKLGYPVPRFDFRVPGVSSISADLHKYGYAAKGASVILYRNMNTLKHQFFISTDWPGGIYASPSLPGTRPGGPIAAAWAALMALGQDGYLVLAERTMQAAAQLKHGVAAIPGLRVVGEPQASIVAYKSDDPAVDIYAVADRLEAGGWHVDRQQSPACIHCTVSAGNSQAVEAYLEDLRLAVEWVRAHPEARSQGDAAMYGMMAKLPARGLVRHGVQKIMEGMYGPEGKLPELGNPGQNDADPLMGLLNKHGAQIQAWLDRWETLRERSDDWLKRLRSWLPGS